MKGTFQPDKKPNNNISYINVFSNHLPNIIKRFLKLSDKHFPKNSKLHKIFNRNSVKVNYSSTENISQILSSHNKKLLQPNKYQGLPCNCEKIDKKKIVRWM